MDKVINITVRNRVAVADPGQHIVCGNEDYTAVFDFDDEWSGIVVKTARFYRGGIYTDVPFHGDTVTIPEMVKVSRVEIGVFAGDMTTTPANVRCYRSILCNGGNVAEPDPDVYAQILELINNLQKDGVSDEQIAEAVEKYIAENPIEGGGGQDGVGIKSVSWTNDFKLKLELTDGMTYVSPPLRGGDGVGMPGQDGVSVTHEWNGTVLTITSASGTSSADLKGERGAKGADGVGIRSVEQTTTSTADGGANVITVTKTNGETSTFTVKNGSKGSTAATGRRGTGLLPVTTAPSAYTTAVNGLTPAYRIALSTVKTQASTTDVYAGDTICQSYYHYPVIYVDSSYVYCGTRVSIRGATGAAGKDGYTPVKGTDYFTDADKAEMVEDVKNNIHGLDDLLGAGTGEATHVPSLAGYMRVETGAIYTGTAGTYHTDYIALDGYKTIKASSNLSSQGYVLAFFDSSKNLLPNISITGEGSSVTKAIDMEVPSNAAYCMLSDYEYSGTSNAYIMLIPAKGIVDRVNVLESNGNPLNGKTIAVLGDSISSVAYTVPNYWQMIAEKTGCKFLDYGVSGSCFAVRSAEHTPSFVERAEDMADADAVLVMGGTNDANKNILLGDWASTDNTTFYGALNALISLLRTKYPGRPIVFCTPIKMKGNKDDGFPKTLADLKSATANSNLELWHCALAIQAKCAVHGIPVIDLFNASGIGSGVSGFFRPDDDLHPSTLGECRIANMIQPVLEQQFLYTTEYAAEPVNLVPLSIDTDGSVFNTTGYKDGYRLSSSGDISAQAGSTVTGFIEFKTSDVLRIKGVTMTDKNAAGTYVNNSYIAFYDSTFTKQGVTNNAGGSGICPNAVNSYRTSEINGVHTYDFSSLDGTNVKYVRISSPYGSAGSGSGMFVTVNQEIT